MTHLPTTLILLPGLAALLAAILGYALPKGDKSDWASMLLCTGGTVLAAILAWVVFVGLNTGTIPPDSVDWFTWINAGSWQVSFGALTDKLSATMYIVVLTVSACVHVYSIGYMAEDPSRRRFFIYLSAFTFAMLMLVSAPNLVQMFMGWEGVGVCSYLLIGFWHHKPSANAAAMKAFLVNRVADAAMLVGMFMLLFQFGSLTYSDIFGQLANSTNLVPSTLAPSTLNLNLAALLIFVGAMGKSAQFGLHTWLPDAMEGPTPVSALIHAATMVTAGVFLLCRLSPLYELTPDVLHIVAWVGALTAIFAATVGLTQTDIKRVIAYSTCSQLGYMFFAIGVSAYPAAMFHLTTHAFFKALLFLGAGSVIHGMHHEQNIFKMGGLRHALPITYGLMWIGSLALAGIPPFAGFFSKDLILESAFMAPGGWAQPIYLVGTLGAMLTAIYGFRIVFMAFNGKFQDTSKHGQHTFHHAHESPWLMLAPMLVLAVGAVTAGFMLSDMGTLEWWQGAIMIDHHHNALHAAHHTPTFAKFTPLILAICGITLSYYLFAEYRHVAKRISQVASIPYAISLNKWYVDELYDYVWVRPTTWLSNALYRAGDQTLIDGTLNATAAAVADVGTELRKTQTGYVAHYAFAMLLALAVGLGLLLWRVL
ncbi:MAG: NADH-quinone oxidoreductase subunit L [Alphaproteobacteria bacterium]